MSDPIGPDTPHPPGPTGESDLRGRVLQTLIDFMTEPSSYLACVLIALVSMIVVAIWSKSCSIGAPRKLALGVTASVTCALNLLVGLLRMILDGHSLVNLADAVASAMVIVMSWPPVWLFAKARTNRQERAGKTVSQIFE